MGASNQHRKKRRQSLLKRQREFIFKKQTQFARVTRDQIHGADYLLEQVDPYIKLLQDFNASDDPKKEFFKCVMFSGPPGTGKTYFARYIATTAVGEKEGIEGIRFVSANGFPRSDPAEPWTAEDVRRLWALLRKYAATGKAVVLFWDQFDGFVEDDSDALDQLCIEIDGLNGRPNGILFIAATTADPMEGGFDEQLMRAGRFNPTDVIEFQPPTRKGRASILRFYFDQKPHDDFDADVFAYLMHDDTTPADVRGFVESAFERAVLRAKKDKEAEPRIEKRDFVFALIAYLVGRPGASATEINKDKLVKTAVHELGHAIVARKGRWPVQLISVIPQRKELGKTFIDWGAPEDNWTFYNARDAVAMLYGGAAAEGVAGYERDAGAKGDYQQATAIAKFFVEQLGGGKRTHEAYGNINLNDFSNKNSEEMKISIERDIGSILKEEEQRAKEILVAVGKEKINAMAEVLAKERVLLGEEFEKLLAEHGVEVESARVF